MNDPQCSAVKSAHILTLATLALIGCAGIETDNSVAHGAVTIWDENGHEELIALPLWQTKDESPSEDAVSLEPGFLQPVAVARITEATGLLERDSIIPVTYATAKRLVGTSYTSPRAVTRQVIRTKEARIKELADLSLSFPESAPKFKDWSAEQAREIDRLRSELPSHSPYLCRAVAFRNCGTGGFSAEVSEGHVWIGYGALGHGEFAKYNQPVVVFLPCRPTASSFSWSVAE